MNTFIDRQAELQKLQTALDLVRSPKGSRGQLVSLRGRRQVGKSTLIQQFIEQTGLPSVFYTATRQSAAQQLSNFTEKAATSGLQTAEIAKEGQFKSWESALRLLARDASPQQPLIVVLDEFPYLIEADPAIESIIQAVWDRVLEQTNVLMILVGSDIATMEALGDYRRPLYGRAQELVLKPLTPAQIIEVIDLPPADTLDAYCVIGGFPRLATLWRAHESLAKFLSAMLSDSTSPLVVGGERMMSAEFPVDLQAREVLSAIGVGARTFSVIGQRSGVEQASLARALDLLQEKRVVLKQLPYSTRSNPKSARYIIADPYLRFWLRFIGPNIDLIERGIGNTLVERICDSWFDYRGRAIEPIVRESIEWMLPDERFGKAMYAGAYWTRDNRVEVDIVGGDEKHRAKTLGFIGSIKWRERSLFDRDDMAALHGQREVVPGVTDQTLLVGVSRSGFKTSDLDIELGPDELINAWRR